MNTNIRLLSNALCIMAALLMISTVCANNAEAVHKIITQNEIKPENHPLQFTTGKHVLGFTPNKAYLAAMDHVLSVEFLGTKGVAPKSDGNILSNKLNKALPMGKVQYENLWEGITLTYEATRDGITESTYQIAPKADVAKIRLKYNAPVELQKDGKLKIKFSKGYMTESAPVAWQEINGKKKPVEVAFRVEKGEVGFRAGQYDPKHALIIDPKYEWHTFYGTADFDHGFGIAVDGSGNVYVTGYSAAEWNGPGGTADVPKHANSGGGDIVVLKLNSSGEYQWHTFYGSSGYEWGYGIAVDGNGNVYVTGGSATGWNGPLAGSDVVEPKHAHSGGYDIVVLKLNSEGEYQWHTFYGGADGDFGDGIAVDGSGNVYVSGRSRALWNGPGGAADAPKHAHSGGRDMVVLKLNSEGGYQWHTFYESADDDLGYAIAVDGNGNVYVAGDSAATWNGPGGAADAPLHAHSGGGSDIVVLKLNCSGEYWWHTFYGSANSDIGNGIALDTNGDVYVTGYSYATWNGPGTGEGMAPKNAYSGFTDIVILKLDSSGTYKWHTFYGSSSGDQANAIALDSSGNVYIGGLSYITWNGPGSGEGIAPNHAHSGVNDIAVLKLDSSGAYKWHTFYGSASDDLANAIAVDGNGNIYVTGVSWNAWNGDGETAPKNNFSGSDRYDIFVLKISRQSYNVTAKAAGNGTGSMKSGPAGISYNYPGITTESAMFLAESDIVITATAGAGSTVSWTTCAAAGGTEAGNGTGNATCALSNLSDTKIVTATFSQFYSKITARAKGTGSGSVVSVPAGISYKYPKKKTDSGIYKNASTVKISAKAKVGSRVSWNKTCKKAGGTEKGNNTKTAVCTIKAAKSAAVTATFRKNRK